MKILIILLSYSSFLYASELLDVISPQDIPLSDFNNSPEVHRFNETIIQDREDATGIITDSHYTALDSNRISLGFQLSPDYTKFNKVQSFDLKYQTHIDGYYNYWLSLQYSFTTAHYNALADERVNSTGNTNSDGNTKRESSSQTISTAGIGVAHRFKLLSLNLKSDRFFETISVHGNYASHKDSLTSLTYTGLGYSAEYGAHYRSGKKVFYGMKLSYHQTWLQRDKIDDNEKLEDRSLVFGHIAAGFELGVFY